MTALQEIAPPGQPAYEAATRVFNLAAPALPAAAVTARSVADVQAAVGHARSRGLPVRVHTTGHAAAAVRPMDGALLIRTALTGGVEVDTARKVARIPAGTLWGEVVAAAAPHGLTAAHGSSANVGAVGFLLRGGLSFYGRRKGLAVNGVRAIEVVTADGELHRVDHENDPGLFWALRGGGGGFGVVTAIKVDLFPATAVITGAAYWPAAHAPELMSIWRTWTLSAPDAVTTSIRVMNLPDHPSVPAPLAGRTTFCVDGAVLVEGRADGDLREAEQHATDLLRPLRAVAEPLVDTWQTAAPAAVLDAHGDPADPVPIVGDHLLLGEIGEEGVAEFLRVTTAAGSPLIVAGLRQLGGAYALPRIDGGVLDHLDARYSYAGSGAPFGPPTPAGIRAACARVRAALAPWDTGRTVPSFVEGYDQPQGHLRADKIGTLDKIRLRVDPEGLLRGDIAPHATALNT
jgi:FAD binding domain-containing protein